VLEQKGVTGIDDDREDEDAEMRMEDDGMDSRRASLVSPTFDHGKHNDPGNAFDPQLQAMDQSPATAMAQSYVPDHASPRWQDLGRIDPVTSSLDDSTRAVLRSQLVAVSARQREWHSNLCQAKLITTT